MLNQIVVSQETAFETLCKDFVKRHEHLSFSETVLDYKVNFSNIKNNEELAKQEIFFINFLQKLRSVSTKQLDLHELIRYSQLNYECNLNLERIALEKKWNDEGRKIPEGGLHSMENYKEWYSYLVKFFTSVNITPEKVFEYGQSEVDKLKKEIALTKTQLGFKTDEAYYAYLKSDTFFITDKNLILKKYAAIDSTVRKNYRSIFPEHEIPEIGCMEWPDAGPSTPPGIYLNRSNNPFGKDVFQFNFYGSKHNARSMEWLYMHEAIPGHHFQFTAKSTLKNEPLKNEFYYFGNAEGWACYIEDFGKEMGLYQNPYSYLGKLEWDLVRSSRLVMEVGIHYYGWSFDKTMQYWKENIKGQDEIATREIKRITNWAGQALCYKVGAKAIKEIVAQNSKDSGDIKNVHRFILNHGDVPLQALLSCSRREK
ncbi:MAG TPA: DUF885 domain-containing protein [Bacteroidia bacterium]|nr:DUF885 domain-containing protein [Bacteroidia bacterium]